MDNRNYVYKRSGNTIFLRINKGNEIVECLKNLCTKENIKAGKIEGLGATDNVKIGIFKSADKKYETNVYNGDYEIASLIGNISTKDNKPYLHIHTSIGNPIENISVSGHLDSAVVSATAEIIITIHDDNIDRIEDPNTGLNLMNFTESELQYMKQYTPRILGKSKSNKSNPIVSIDETIETESYSYTKIKNNAIVLDISKDTEAISLINGILNYENFNTSKIDGYGTASKIKYTEAGKNKTISGPYNIQFTDNDISINKDNTRLQLEGDIDELLLSSGHISLYSNHEPINESVDSDYNMKYKFFTTDQELIDGSKIITNFHSKRSGIIEEHKKYEMIIIGYNNNKIVGFSYVLKTGHNTAIIELYIYNKDLQIELALLNKTLNGIGIFDKFKNIVKVQLLVSKRDTKTKDAAISLGFYEIGDYSTATMFIYKINKTKSFITKYLARFNMLKYESSNIKTDYTLNSRIYNDDIVMDNSCIKSADSIMFFNDFVQENAEYIEEANTNNTRLKKLLYDERIRTDKELLDIYKKVKQDAPFIKYTYRNYDLYKGRNLFIDLSYYTESFFRNNFNKLDKGIKLYFDFVNRLMEDKRLHGYDKQTIFLPLMDWYKEGSVIWDYKDGINPISVIFRMIKTDSILLKSKWGKFDIVILTDTGYFKFNVKDIEFKDLNKLKTLITALISREPIIDEEQDKTDSPKVITTTIIDKIENNSRIKINNISGSTAAVVGTKPIKHVLTTSIIDTEKDEEQVNKTINIAKKDELVNKIKTVAADSNSVDDAIEKLDQSDETKELIDAIDDTEFDGIKISAARNSRMNDLNTKLLSSTFKGKSLKDILGSENEIRNSDLPETALPVDSINDEWQHMKYINIDKVYDVDNDIWAILQSLSTKSIPIAIDSYTVTDNTTSEDSIYTWDVKFEDVYGKRFSFVFDVPKLKFGRFMKLRGNDKTIQGQLMNLPIIKTGADTCQVVSNYNKIIISRYGLANGKSYPIADRIIKSLRKYSGSNIKIISGDNSRICSKYELPMDYIDLASNYSRIEIKDKSKDIDFVLYFNQDELKENFTVDKVKGIPLGTDHGKLMYWNGSNSTIYITEETIVGPSFNSCSGAILGILNNIEEFKNIYKSTSVGAKYTYSRASILNTEIPIIVICGYSEGLTKVLNKAKINYNFSTDSKRYDKNDYDKIDLKDGYLYYQITYESILLMNGLKDCDTYNFTYKEMDSKQTWLSFLDNFGGRIKSDGLDNFYDLMVDPMTKNVCLKYKLPYDYVEMLIYASNLIADNKYNRHVDITGNRYRSAEIIAGYVYKEIATAYGTYRNKLKREKSAAMTIKQSAIIDAIMKDNTESDVSAINELNFAEAANAVSFKGLSGLNSERAYSLDKRTYDDSMLNILGMSTGFAANVGVTRQTTIDMNIDDVLGCIKPSGSDNMSVTKSFSITEALTPFGATRDDPFRSAMTFIQTSKHSLRVNKSDPPLITNGAEEAVAYMTPDIFSYKSKGNGKVIQKTNDFMIVQYDESGKTEFIDLTNQIYKNSDGGFYVAVKLDTDLNVGDSISNMQVLAYDKKSYSKEYGNKNNPVYEIGTLCKVAIFNTAEGYEDSTMIGEWLSEASTTEVIYKKDVYLKADSEISNMLTVGSIVQEGDPLMYYQKPLDDESANRIARNMNATEEEINEIGKIVVKSPLTGIIQDIKIYRTTEIENLSNSIQEQVKKYESNIAKTKKILDKYDKEKSKEFRSNYKLDPTGKLKKARDSVLIEFYLKYTDKAGIGDKFVIYSALKGVVRDVFPKEDNPTSTYRPDEDVDIFLSVGSVNRRMVASVKPVGLINKAMIELDRHVKEIMGIEWHNLHE